MLGGRPRFVLVFFAPNPEIQFFAALDAVSINTGASALTDDFAKSDTRPFPFLDLGFLVLGFLTLTPKPTVLATDPIFGSNSPKILPINPMPF